MKAGRWRHHVAGAFVSALFFVLARLTSPEQETLDHLSISTAWLCFLFIAAALLTGPIIAYRTNRRVINHYFRRDLGIWAALTGLVHFFVATDQSMSQSYLAVYVNVLAEGLSAELRGSLFSWGSIGGFVAGLFLLVLLAISSDKALTKLGQKRWKQIQFLAYPAFVLTTAHGVAFQLLESRAIGLIAVLLLLFSAALCFKVFVIFHRTSDS